jgi:hypothetical protein
MKRFDKGQDARRAARNKAQKAPGTRVVPDKRKDRQEEESCPYCTIRGCEGRCRDED